MYDITNKKGLTLIKDDPVWIDANYTVSSDYNSEKLISISAGIDQSLWGLIYNASANEGDEYQLVKWQTI